MTRPIVDRVGQRFGKLLVVKFAYVKNTNSHWECLCDCGNLKIISNANFSGKRRPVKSCGCLLQETSYKRSKEGYKSVWGVVWKDIKRRGKKRDANFDLSAEYLYKLMEKQHWRCALSGVILTLPQNYQEGIERNWTASLDRIDSTKNYTEDNVQWVHKYVNFMKQNFSDEEYIDFCHKVSDFQRAKQCAS